MVRTPWYPEEIPFNMAAEIGTQKVINEHSTIGLVVTTDGSISAIPRDEYEEAEERVINELKEINKPFIVVMNCVEPQSAEAVSLCQSMSAKYDVPVIPVNCLELDEDEINAILERVLYEFPVTSIALNFPCAYFGRHIEWYFLRIPRCSYHSRLILFNIAYRARYNITNTINKPYSEMQIILHGKLNCFFRYKLRLSCHYRSSCSTLRKLITCTFFLKFPADSRNNKSVHKALDKGGFTCSYRAYHTNINIALCS